MFEVVKIDSLKLRIPKHKVTYVDPTFCEEYQKIYLSTGEIDEHINLEKHRVNYTNGISTRIAEFHSLNGSFAEEQIVIQCNAKQLRESYFEGINLKNLRKLYDFIIDLKIISFKYEDFLGAYVSVIDLCYDAIVDPKTMIEANQEIYRNIKPTYYKYVGRPFRQSGNVGLQFNSREKATPAKPYVKIYHKTLELLNKSNEFAEAYLKEINWKNIGRLEFTIKNSKHRKYLDFTFNNLKELLEINPKDFEDALFSGVLCYIEKKSILKDYSLLSPTKRLLLCFINRTIALGDDKQAIYTALNIFDIPQEKSRMKKLLRELTNQVDDKNRLVANRDTMNFLRTLRLNL